MDRVDLHTHSMYSDGTFSPTDIIEMAKAKGLRAVSITDHDTVNGLLEGERAALAAGIEFVYGIEISAYYKGTQIHILGYHIDPKSSTLAAKLEQLAQTRSERNTNMLQALARVGVNISPEQLEHEADGAVITRAHFARALYSGGHVKSIQDAFDRYVSSRGSAFVPHESIAIRDCIEFIRSEGGVPVLAHPFLYGPDLSRTENLVSIFVEYGLMGIETFYSSHSASNTGQIIKWANKYRLVMTGGSDFHGGNRIGVSVGTGWGNLFVPYSVVEKLQEAKNNLGNFYS